MSSTKASRIEIENEEQRLFVMGFLEQYIMEYNQARIKYQQQYSRAKHYSTLRHGDSVRSFYDMRCADGKAQMDQHIEAVKVFITNPVRMTASISVFESDLNEFLDDMHEQHQFHLSCSSSNLI